MAALAFIRIGRTWINPAYITSISIKTIEQAARVELKLTTQQSQLTGNIYKFQGEQKRCCYWWDFRDVQTAEKWVQHKFKPVLQGSLEKT